MNESHAHLVDATPADLQRRAAAFAAGNSQAAPTDAFDQIRKWLKKLNIFQRIVKSEGNASGKAAEHEVRDFLSACRSVFIALAVFSSVSNILMLTGSFYMLQVYDRVLTSRSVSTLIGLSILALLLYSLQGILDLIRSRMNVRVGRFLDNTLSPRVYSALINLPLRVRGDGDGMQPLRDLDHVRSFLSGGGPSAFFDLPWMVFFLGICFLFHFWIGVTALVGGVILVALALAAEFRTKAATALATQHARTRNALASAGQRNAEVLCAMGMGPRLANLWGESNRSYLAANERAADAGGGIGAISKTVRMILQSAVLAVGAYLVINQQASAGIIIAGAILTSRALAPVETAIVNWKGFVAARQGAERLHKLLVLFPQENEPMALPKPRARLTVDRLSATAPGAQRLIVQDVSFELTAGQGLGIIGTSGSGKSSLVRSLVGVWQPVRGQIRIDNAALDQWLPTSLGPHIGYLPQDVELFDDTVAKNIARMDEHAEAAAILAAVQLADVHDLVLTLPKGYATIIGESGMALSAGQRQRIALARALYGDPFLVVLDEPSSNLDAAGEEALTRAILSVRARGGIVVVVSHRPSGLAGVDHVLVMSEGKAQAFGTKDEILRKVLQHPMPATITAAVGGRFQ